MAMVSCLYECRVMHARFSPKAHAFAYRIFLFAIDLDELEALHRRLRLFSFGKRNLYSFRDGDFLPTNDHASLKDRILAHLRAQGIDLTGGRVMLITQPRVLGYLFNPVSFYFCHDRRGEPVAALAEVTNTFREIKPYVLGPECRDQRGFSRCTPKFFYVSPFSDVDVAFDFQLGLPGEQLAVKIDDYAEGRRTLTSTLSGQRLPLTDTRLAWFTLKYPLITLKIIALIHWHAFRLWVKRVPWFAKAARRADQRSLLRPHVSLGTNHPAAAAPGLEGRTAHSIDS